MVSRHRTLFPTIVLLFFGLDQGSLVSRCPIFPRFVGCWALQYFLTTWPLLNFSVLEMTSTRFLKVLVLGHSFLRWLSLTLRTILILALPRLLTSRGMFMFIYMASAVARSSSWLAMTWASLPIFFPDVAILKIGSNDLTILSLEVVGSNIDNLVRLLRRSFAVKVVGICEIIPRGGTLIHAPRNSKGKLISRMPSGLSHTPPRLQSIGNLLEESFLLWPTYAYGVCQIAHSLHFASLGWFF